ncbi:MAG: sterol desaturase family protein [Rhodospirillales bacterium]|nr:sterol desaturase family protein [Rhodospirillales bacterium]
MEFLILYEDQVRLFSFAGVLAVMALLENLFPRRQRRAPTARRWGVNLALTAINTVTLRLLFPLLAVEWAALMTTHDIGLAPILGVPYWAACLVGIALLDLVIYAQHAAFHHIPFLWRFHRVHHADLEVDVTTGVRFHPGEIVLSMLIKFATIALLGVPAAAVVAFEVLLNATSLFHHANLALPRAVDRVLRLVIVTPDVHRVHHSTIRAETDSNFGFSVTWWDRLFGTFRAEPSAGHTGMEIGLAEYRVPAQQGLLWVCALPAYQNPPPASR